jgi:hypothetical protein
MTYLAIKMVPTQIICWTWKNIIYTTIKIIFSVLGTMCIVCKCIISLPTYPGSKRVGRSRGNNNYLKLGLSAHNCQGTCSSCCSGSNATTFATDSKTIERRLSRLYKGRHNRMVLQHTHSWCHINITGIGCKAKNNSCVSANPILPICSCLPTDFSGSVLEIRIKLLANWQWCSKIWHFSMYIYVNHIILILKHFV